MSEKTESAMQWAYAQVRKPSGYYWHEGGEGGRWLVDATTDIAVPYDPNIETGGYTYNPKNPPVITDMEGGRVYAYDPGKTFNQVLYGNFVDYPPIDLRLTQIASAAGLYGFDWRPYQAIVARAGTLQRYSLFNNYMIPVLTWAMEAAKDYPQIWKIIPEFAEGSPAWIEGERVAQETRDRNKRAGQIEMAVMAVVGAFFGAAALAAGAAGSAAATGSTAASGAVVAETGVATVQGAELAALVESGTVGAEGAFLEAAALTGSSVTYATGTGAILSAVTPAGETVLFDATVDPFTQFGQMPIDNVQLPQESLNAPNQTPQTPNQGNIAPQGQPVTEYAKKLLASEALKLLTGGKQSPGATAVSQQNAAAQQLAPGQEMGDITPLVALAMIAGAFVLRKKR